MKIVVLFLLISLPAFAAVRVDLEFASSELVQGDPTEARLTIDESSTLPVQSLKGKTIGKVLYFLDVSPLMKREGAPVFEAQAKVIFVKPPESQGASEVLGGQEIILNWGKLSVRPVEASQELIYGEFTVPEKVRWLLWVGLTVLIVGAAFFVGRFTYRRVSSKRALKARRDALKQEILGARNYEDIVELWKKKQTYFKEFPHVRDAFDKFEEVLNRHQFKPRQSEAEKIEITEAYRKFLRSVEGGFSGV